MSIGRSDPAPSFRFRVEFRGGPDVSARFTECSGLEFETELFEYREGGDQSRMHRLPGGIKYGNLELKRGIATDGEPLWRWVRDMARGEIRPCHVTISLFAADGAVVRDWTFVDAYPVKWSATAFSAQENAIAIETLALAHQGLLLAY